jgi:hypothetical protein
MSPYILLTSTPYSLNSDLLDGLDSTAFGQLANNQTWTGTNTFQPTTNISGLVVKQTSASSPTADIFNVQTANGSSDIQVTGPAANNAGVAISSIGAQAITLTSGAALTFTGAANSTWDLGAGHTLSLQTTGNGAITTGTGLLTVGGNVAFSGSSARTITGPSTGGLTITAAGPVALSATGSNALTLTGSSASIWSTTAGTLTIQSASGSAFTASAQGTGQSNFGTAGTGTTVLGNTTGDTELLGPSYGSSTGGVLIGDGTVTSTPILLQLNNSSVSPTSEASANCSTTINAGAIYYSAATASNNTTTNEVRACIDGSWTDVVTADQLGIMLFGVVEDSGQSAGDINGISGYANAPCKVSWVNATSVSVAPCTAYSGGRKVVVSSAVTISGLGNAGSIRFQHICLTGTNGAPQATVSSPSETIGVPAWSPGAPVLCLATVKLNTTPAITNIYDTRVFTTSTKEYAGNSVAMAPGWIVVIDGTGDNLVTTTSSAGASGVRGVVAAGNPSATTNNVGVVIVTAGPAYVKFTSSPNVGAVSQTGTTAGYMATTTTTNKYGLYRDLGQVVANGNAVACTAINTCQYSALVDVVLY